DSEYKIEGFSARRRQLIPALAAQPFSRQLHMVQELDRYRVDGTLRMAAGTEASEFPASPVMDQALGEDTARRIAGAEEQNVVRPLSHVSCFDMQVADCGQSNRNSE